MSTVTPLLVVADAVGGSPVVLQLRVADLDAAVAQLVGRGAALLAGPIEFCGECMARARDPFAETHRT